MVAHEGLGPFGDRPAGEFRSALDDDAGRFALGVAVDHAKSHESPSSSSISTRPSTDS